MEEEITGHRPGNRMGEVLLMQSTGEPGNQPLDIFTHLPKLCWHSEAVIYSKYNYSKALWMFLKS